MSHEVPFEDLADYVEGRLAPDDAARLEAHLATGCPSCAADVAWLRHTLGLMAADRLVDAPAATVRRAQGLYRARPDRSSKTCHSDFPGGVSIGKNPKAGEPELELVVRTPVRRTPLTARQRLCEPSAPGRTGATPRKAHRRAHYELARSDKSSKTCQIWRMPAPARVAAVALTVLLVLGGVWAWGGTSVTQAATLAEVQGLVQVRLPGSATWQEALPGQALSAGCALRSSAGARVAVQYPDGSRSYLIGEAEVEIVNLSGRRDGRATSVQLSQAAGHTQHDMASAESSIQVESTGGAAQASAATYDVWVSDGEMDVAASRGQVTLGDGQEKTRLGAGQRGRVGHGRLKAATATPDPTATPQPTAEPQATPEAATPDTPEAEASPTPGKPGHGRQPTPGPAAKPTKDHTPPGQAKDKESPGQQKKARETTTPQLTPPSDEEGKRHN